MDRLVAMKRDSFATPNHVAISGSVSSMHQISISATKRGLHTSEISRSVVPLLLIESVTPFSEALLTVAG
jgi:hypothetical protein